MKKWMKEFLVNLLMMRDAAELDSKATAKDFSIESRLFAKKKAKELRNEH